MAETNDNTSPNHEVAAQLQPIVKEIRCEKIEEGLHIAVQPPLLATVGEVIRPLVLRFVKSRGSDAKPTFLVRPFDNSVPTQTSFTAVHKDRESDSSSSPVAIVDAQHTDINNNNKKQDNQSDEANTEDKCIGGQPKGVRFDPRYRCAKAKISLIKNGHTIFPVQGVPGGGDTGREGVWFRPAEPCSAVLGAGQSDGHGRGRHMRSSERASEESAGGKMTYCMFDAITFPSPGTWRVLVQCMDWLGNETGRVVSREVVVGDRQILADEEDKSQW